MMDDAPSMPKFNNAMARDELRDELAGKDLSDFVAFFLLLLRILRNLPPPPLARAY